MTNGDYKSYTVSNVELSVIRTDIKKFYPSVNKHKLYQRISNSSLLNYESMEVLKTMFFTSKIKGIPLGFPFSGHLAEIYLEKFDYDVRLKLKPLFYFRYVDDIIIINYSSLDNLEEADNLRLKLLEEIFTNYDLKMNKNKTQKAYIFKSAEQTKLYSFDYLGYSFSVENQKLIVDISREKVIKLKKRILYLFYLYKKSSKSNEDFWKLYYRLKNILYGVTSIDKNQKVMKFGLGYSYKYINSTKQLKEIIKFIRVEIYKCQFEKKKYFTISGLLPKDNQELSLLKRRHNYTNLTINQINQLKKRIGLHTASNNLSRIFYVLYKDVNY